MIWEAVLSFSEQNCLCTLSCREVGFRPQVDAAKLEQPTLQVFCTSWEAPLRKIYRFDYLVKA
jgi:hypothetical protein